MVIILRKGWVEVVSTECGPFVTNVTERGEFQFDDTEEEVLESIESFKAIKAEMYLEAIERQDWDTVDFYYVTERRAELGDATDKELAEELAEFDADEYYAAFAGEDIEGNLWVLDEDTGLPVYKLEKP